MARQPLAKKGCLYAQMRAQDKPYEEILQELFGLGPDCDPKEKNKAAQQLWRWRTHPDFDNVFEKELERILRIAGGGAARVLVEQMKDKDQPWLRNKAANDVMNHRKQVIYGENEKQITVKVEGMPELGIPDQGE